MAPRIHQGSFRININNISSSFSSSSSKNNTTDINTACSSPNNNVPSSFLCPISLSVMRDPVTLPSGITYDRGSLQKWLRDGNVTCPVTMSVIGKNPQLIPNTVLKTLIKQWSKTHKSVKKSTAPDQMDLRSTIDSLLCGIQRLSCLTKLRGWIKTGELTKDQIEEEDVVAVLLSVLKSAAFCDGNDWEKCTAMAMEDELVLQETVSVLAMAIRSDGKLQSRALSDEEMKKVTVCAIAWVLRRSGCFETRSFAAQLVEWLASHGSASVLEAIASSKYIISGLVSLTLASESRQYSPNPNPKPVSVKPAVLAGLCALAVVAQDPAARPAVIAGLLNYPNSENENNYHNVNNCRSPAIYALIEQLPGSGKSRTEKILSLLSSSCLFSHQARAVVRAHALAIPALVRSLLVVSELANELAIAILWSMIAMDRDREREASAASAASPERKSLALEAAQNGASQKLLVVAQMDCTVQTKRRINELLKELPRVHCPHSSTSQTILY